MMQCLGVLGMFGTAIPITVPLGIPLNVKEPGIPVKFTEGSGVFRGDLNLRLVLCCKDYNLEFQSLASLLHSDQNQGVEFPSDRQRVKQLLNYYVKRFAHILIQNPN